LAFNSVIGLYDQQGMLRFAGLDRAECLAYAELFALDEGSFCLESLFGAELETCRALPPV
jgi:hypothetical protein